MTSEEGEWGTLILGMWKESETRVSGYWDQLWLPGQQGCWVQGRRMKERMPSSSLCSPTAEAIGNQLAKQKSGLNLTPAPGSWA